MKHSKFIIIIAMVLFFAVDSFAADQGWTGNVNFTLGAKSLDEDDWEPIEDQGEIGIHLDLRTTNWPVSIYLAFLASYGDDTTRIDGFRADVEGRTSEFRFGVRKIWEPTTNMRPYFGGGLALVTAEIEVSAFGEKLDDSDSALGFWLGGGIYWTLGEHFNIGLDIAWSKAEVTLFDTDGEAGGGHAGLLLGYHW